MENTSEETTLNALSSEFVSWQVVSSKTRNKINMIKNEVKFQVHLNHFYDVESIPFDILVDVPAENCINCLGPRHFKCDKLQSHDYCFNCGRSGVRVSTCPRCRHAYPKYLERRKKVGFGRDRAKAKVDEMQNEPVQPVSKVCSATPVIAETKINPVLPDAKESSMWPFAVKSSLMPMTTDTIKISSNISNVQLINDDSGLYNGKMVGSTMQSTTSSSSAGCGTCKLCKPSQQCQTLMPQNFMKVVESNINHRPKSFFVITDGLIFGNLASIPFDPLVDPGPYVCFNCWESGHSYVECNQSKPQCFCQNCGRKGVIMKDCPRCASAYLEFGLRKMELRCQRSGDVYREVEHLHSTPKFQVHLNHFYDVESIPFDIEMDVPADNCINCLEPRHSKSKLCDNPRSGDYCFNCGRSGVRVYTCPRCRNAYPSYRNRRDKALGRDTAKAKVKNPLAICGTNDQPSNSLIHPTQYSAKKCLTKTPTPGPFNLYFKALRDIVVQSVHNTKTSKPSDKQCMEITHAINDTVSGGICEEYLSDEEDEDLDQIIVDENEKPQMCRPPSEGVREFLNLMDAVRHLPIDAQSSVALQFVRKRRVLMNERKEKAVDKR